MVFWYNLFFSKNLIFPTERRGFLKKNNNKTIKKVAKLLTYGGQVIDPTAYIYIYVALDRSAANILGRNLNFSQVL